MIVDIILFIVILIFLIYSADISIKFRPFNIKVKNPYRLFWLVLLIIGIGFFSTRSYFSGYKKGRVSGEKFILHKVDSVIKSKKDNVN